MRRISAVSCDRWNPQVLEGPHLHATQGGQGKPPTLKPARRLPKSKDVRAVYESEGPIYAADPVSDTAPVSERDYGRSWKLEPSATDYVAPQSPPSGYKPTVPMNTAIPIHRMPVDAILP
jgi:hypothetical protein